MTVPEKSSARIFASVVRGSDDAADELFHRYLKRLSQLARSRLAPRVAQRVDPEDIVMSAYRSFFVAAREGRFDIERSGDLWALLTTITLRKLYRTSAHHSAAKRDVANEADLPEDFNLDQWVTSREPEPGEAIALAEEVEAVLQALPSVDRRILELRLQGELMGKIAADTGTSERTVRRTLAAIQDGIAAKHGEVVVARSDKPAKPSPSASVVFASALDRTDSIAFDRILLQRLIGRGGMGKVYEAVHRDTDEKLAVKFLHKFFRNDHVMAERFLEEAAIVQRLDHSGIVKTRGIGQLHSGVQFIVMDLIDGTSLDQLPHPPSLAAIVGWTIELAEALSHAHQANVVHCDLKPANVMITAGGHPIVMDFGLARVLAHTEHRRQSMGGTAPWMAPEQIDSSLGSISPQTDVYGLGALLYTLLTGKPPFPGKRTPDVLARIVSAEIPIAPSAYRFDIPALVERLCLQCLEKSPGNRPQSMADVVLALSPNGSPNGRYSSSC